MLHLRSETRDDGRCRHFAALQDERPVSFREALGLLESSASFRELLTGTLAGSDFRAFRWETPALAEGTAERPFEFVLVDAPDLPRPPDVEVFAAEFTPAPVAVFENLGGDALLIVPCPLAEPEAYVHLATFVRQAPDAQVHQLWRTVGRAALDRLSPQPLWLSTAGGGVAWLHVRLDSRPKYYSYAPFARI